jgi:hypothetical protein
VEAHGRAPEMHDTADGTEDALVSVAEPPGRCAATAATES